VDILLKIWLYYRCIYNTAPRRKVCWWVTNATCSAAHTFALNSTPLARRTSGISRNLVLPSRRRQHRRTVRITPAHCAPTHPIARCPWHFVPVDRHLVRPRRRRKNSRFVWWLLTHSRQQPSLQRHSKFTQKVSISLLPKPVNLLQRWNTINWSILLPFTEWIEYFLSFCFDHHQVMFKLSLIPHALTPLPHNKQDPTTI